MRFFRWFLTGVGTATVLMTFVVVLFGERLDPNSILWLPVDELAKIPRELLMVLICMLVASWGLQEYRQSKTRLQRSVCLLMIATLVAMSAIYAVLFLEPRSRPVFLPVFPPLVFVALASIVAAMLIGARSRPKKPAKESQKNSV